MSNDDAALVAELRQMVASVPPGVEVDTWSIVPEDLARLLDLADEALLSRERRGDFAAPIWDERNDLEPGGRKE